MGRDSKEYYVERDIIVAPVFTKFGVYVGSYVKKKNCFVKTEIELSI